MGVCHLNTCMLSRWKLSTECQLPSYNLYNGKKQRVSREPGTAIAVALLVNEKTDSVSLVA
jgi:hypothetical protein